MDRDSNLRVKGRRVPAPKFVNAKWVEVQIGSSALTKIPEISSALAEKYDHWGALAKKYENWPSKTKGEKEVANDEFCEKVAYDLGRPGFFHDVENSVKVAKKKQMRSIPFSFMISRFRAYPLGTNNELHEKVMHAVIKKWKDGEAVKEEGASVDFEYVRDFLFFATIVLKRTPREKTVEMIKDTDLFRLFKSFWADFDVAVNEHERAERKESMENAKEEWRKNLDQLAADMKELSDGDPDPKKAEELKSHATRCLDTAQYAAESYIGFRDDIEKDKTRHAVHDLAARLESYKKPREIQDLFKYLKGIEEQGGDFDVTRCAVAVNKIESMLLKRKNLRSEISELVDDEESGGLAEKGLEVEKLDDEIKKIAVDAVPELRERKEEETRKEAIRKEKERKEEERRNQAKDRKEKEQARKQEEERKKIEKERKQEEERKQKEKRQQEEDRKRKYANWINDIAGRLAVMHEFDLAYHVACCGEKGAEEGKTDFSMLAFPSRALRFLSFPDMTSKGEVVGKDLNAALDVHSHDEDVSRSRKILVFAAGLFPAIFHLPSHARALYGAGHRIDNCGGKLDGIGGALQSLEGRKISVSDFHESGREDPVAESIRHLKEWYERNKKSTSQIIAVASSWEEWMREDGDLGRVILPLIGKNPTEGVNHAAEFVKETHKAAIKRINKTKTYGSAKKHLLADVQEAVSLIKNVVECLQGRGDSPEKRGETHQKCVAFRNALADAGDYGFVQDGRFSDALSTCIQRAASFFAEDTAENIFLGKSIKEIPGLAKITGVRHDGQGNPYEGHSNALVELIEKAIKQGWLEEDPCAACERQIKNKALLSARLIESKSDLSVVRRMELEKVIKKQIPQLRKQLEKRKGDAEGMLDDSRVPEDLRDKWQKNLSAVMPEKLPAGDSEEAKVYDFPHAFEIVEATGNALRSELRKSGSPTK